MRNIFLIFCIALCMASCSKRHVYEVKVVIEHGVVYRHVLNQTYVEPGAYGIDYMNKRLAVEIDTGDLNVNKAGIYTITYTARDEYDNTGTAERKVVVYNELEYLDGSWSFYKYNLSSGILDTIYIETLRSSDERNRLFFFTRFSNYENAKVQASITANLVKIDSLQYTIGPGSNIQCTFYGFGTQMSNNKLEISYGEIFNNNTTLYTGVISRE
jgi:hypothetical protein